MNDYKKPPPTCNDFTFRDGRIKQGCGEEIRLIKDAEGSWKACEPIMCPVHDKDGNFLYAWIPHWLFCRHGDEERAKHIAKQEARKEQFRSQHDDSQGQSEDRGNQNAARGGLRKAGTYQNPPTRNFAPRNR